MKKDYGLILGLLKIYEDPEPRFADFAIHCAGENGEEIVWCHKIVLVLRSEYFDGLLRTEPETKSISLPDYSFEVVKAVVKSAIAVEEEELKKVDLIEVIRLADFLQMKHLIKSVSRMLCDMLDLTNVSDIFNLAQSSYFPDLLQGTKHFIKENMFELCKKGSLLGLLNPLLEDLKDKNPGDEDKYTLMHCAAEHGQLNIVEYLVPLLILDDKNPKAGPREYPNGLTLDQVTPLHLAACAGNLPVIEFLVPHLNGDINPATSDGFTVLHYAAFFGHLNVVAYYTGILDNPNPGLISNNASRGMTPLHYAALEGHLEVVKHFCNLLEDKNPSDDNGDTPLHIAASAGHIEIVKYLVQYLDNKHPKAGSYWNYETPLDLAKKKGHTEVVNFLENL